MATASRNTTASLATRPPARLVEWGLLIFVIFGVILVAGQYVRVVQAQAERSAVLSTLGALRTGLVVAHLKRAGSTAEASRRAEDPNPFAVLESLPRNYRGEQSLSDVLATLSSGWVYDASCNCIGYVPLDESWSAGTSQAGALWFKVASGAGPRELKAQGTYTWRGVLVQ